MGDIQGRYSPAADTRYRISFVYSISYQLQVSYRLVRAKYLQHAGLVYDVSNGLLTELPIDFTERDVEALQNCFDLYEYDGEHTSDLGPQR